MQTIMADDQLLHEERLSDELRYTEKRVEPEDGRPARRCELWLDGEEKHVAYLTLVSFRQRLGAVALDAEGFASVATVPAHRRKGFMKVFFSKAMARAADRVDALFLYGIDRFYPKYGFATCYTASQIHLTVRNGLRASPGGAAGAIRKMTGEDYPGMCDLYNQAHGNRSWTHERDPAIYPGPVAATDWNAGESGWVLEQERDMLGYYTATETTLGTARPLRVTEICAASAADAETLIAHVVAAALARRQEKVSFVEPPDSTVGRTLKRLGCDVVLSFSADGSGMGKIMNRGSLVRAMQPEFERRAGGASDEAISALAEGRLYPVDTDLMPLLTGHHSWRDAADQGQTPPPEYEAEVRAWFPGPSDLLPIAFTHHRDCY